MTGPASEDPTGRRSAGSPPPPPGAPSRRRLLTGAAAGGLLAAACDRARGTDGRDATGGVDALPPLPSFRARAPLADGEPVRIGVIGAGRMGLTHCQSFSNPRVWNKLPIQVVAVSDVCAPRLERAHRALREQQAGLEVEAHRSHRRLFELGLHGVVIATPVHWHVPLAIEALAAGLDVYVEKPSSNRLDEALQLRRAAEASGGVVQVGAQMVREPKYAAARELIAAGRIGTPTCAQTSYCRNSLEGEWLYPIDESVRPGEALDWEAWCGPRGPSPWDPAVFHRWQRYRKFSTGILGDMLVHVLTPLVWSLDAGWPVRVTASGAHRVDTEMENHDQVALTVQLESGATLLALGSTCSELGLETLIRGNQATLYLGGNHCALTPERVHLDVEPEERRFEGIHAQLEHRRDWIQCIRSREQPMGDVETAAKVAAIIDLGTRALWDGGSWELDPTTLRTRRA